MKNKDMPAMPATVKVDRNPPPGSGYPTSKDVACSGLTKREMFAMHAMQNILGRHNPYESGDFDSSDYKLTAKHAVGLADALLAELDK